MFVKKEMNKKTSELKITISADQNTWKSKQEITKKELSANLQVDGFRKGKVPDNLISKYISNSDIWHKALPKMLDSLALEASKEIKEKELVLDSPYYIINQMSLTQLEVSFVYPMYPEIQLSDYKSLKAKFIEPTVDDKIIEQEIKNLRNMHSVILNVNRAAKKGDVVKFDFAGYIEGKTFDRLQKKNHELELGSKNFIEGFEEQLIGVKSGDKKDINIKFPKDYDVQEFRGKTVIFKCLIHSVSEKQIPAFDDDLAKEINVPNIKTAVKLKQYIKDVMKQQAIQQARVEFKNAAFAEIAQKTTLVLPSSLVVKEMKNQESNFIEMLKKQGIDKNTYMQSQNIDNIAFNSQMKSQAEKTIKESFIFAEIAKLENIKLLDKDYDVEYEKLAKIYKQDVDTIKKQITKSQLQIPMTNEKVIDIVIKGNN